MPRSGTEERRRKGRLRIPRLVRVRPSQPGQANFDEVLPTQNAALNSVYFFSKSLGYKDGMRLFITFPYSEDHGSINQEFLGKVVRIDELDHCRRGIAVQILMPLYLGAKETHR